MGMGKDGKGMDEKGNRRWKWEYGVKGKGKGKRMVRKREGKE